MQGYFWVRWLASSVEDNEKSQNKKNWIYPTDRKRKAMEGRTQKYMKGVKECWKGLEEKCQRPEAGLTSASAMQFTGKRKRQCRFFQKWKAEKIWEPTEGQTHNPQEPCAAAGQVHRPWEPHAAARLWVWSPWQVHQNQRKTHTVQFKGLWLQPSWRKLLRSWNNRRLWTTSSLWRQASIGVA